MANLSLTMALSHYDRHVPLFDGSVTADKVDLQVLEVGQGEVPGQRREHRIAQQIDGISAAGRDMV